MSDIDDSELVTTAPPLADSPAVRIGVLGGRLSGKTYLLQSIVHSIDRGLRSLSTLNLSGTTTLIRADDYRSEGKYILLDTFIDSYLNWRATAGTDIGVESHYWFRISRNYRAATGGYLPINIDFYDVAGEWLTDELESRNAWNELYGKTDVLVFCLPFWCVFPSSKGAINPERMQHFDFLDEQISKFHLSEASKNATRIIALTMADDDELCGANALREEWIHEAATLPADTFSSTRNVARYFENLRNLSKLLGKEMQEPRVGKGQRIYNGLTVAGRPPFVLPISAFDGRTFATKDAIKQQHGANYNTDQTDPVPVNVDFIIQCALGKLGCLT